MKCKTCSHPQRQAIDLALLAEDHTFATLSNIYGLSISSLFRHKKHLASKMRRARQRLQDCQDQASLLKLNAFLDHVERAVQTAEVEGNIDQVLKGSQVGSRIIHHINQMEVPLELATVYRLISSPLWTSRDSLLPADPQIITGIHQAITDAALFPCPEPAPEPATAAEEDDDDEYDDDYDDEEGDDDEDREEDHEEENDAADSLSRETHTRLRELLADLIANAETDPKIMREKSANLPEKLLFLFKNIPINQIDEIFKKLFPKNSFPDAGLAGNQQPETVSLETQNSNLGTFLPRLCRT